MKKYRKFKRRTFNPYIICITVFVGICLMSVGYAISTDTLTIEGIANAKYETYYITYELNGGINPENALTEFKMIDDIPLPIPTKEGYTFKGWYLQSNFSGARINTPKGIKKSITLYAKWRQVINSDEVYNYNGSYTFNGNNYINTNVYLYSEETVNRNFIISFNIDSVSDSNINHSTLMNSMNESGRPWSGHVVKVSKTQNLDSVLFQSNSNTSDNGDVVIDSTVRNVRIIRINHILYCSFDGNKCFRINNYTGFTDTFDIPVYFGASNDGYGNVFRYFTGTLSDMSISFLDDDVTIDDFNPQDNMVVAYQHDGPLVFNGTSDYINTNFYPFTTTNVHKDFEVSFTINSIDSDIVNQGTIVNAKDESNNAYPGFVYRVYPSNNTIKLEAKCATGSGASNSLSSVHKVKIERINDIIYLTINDGERKTAYDFTSFTKYFNRPMTIGCSLNSSGNPFRFFKGTLSNILVKVEQ